MKHRFRTSISLWFNSFACLNGWWQIRSELENRTRSCQNSGHGSMDQCCCANCIQVVEMHVRGQKLCLCDDNGDDRVRQCIQINKCNGMLNWTVVHPIRWCQFFCLCSVVFVCLGVCACVFFPIVGIVLPSFRLGLCPKPCSVGLRVSFSIVSKWEIICCFTYNSITTIYVLIDSISSRRTFSLHFSLYRKSSQRAGKQSGASHHHHCRCYVCRYIVPMSVPSKNTWQTEHEELDGAKKKGEAQTYRTRKCQWEWEMAIDRYRERETVREVREKRWWLRQNGNG